MENHNDRPFTADSSLSSGVSACSSSSSPLTYPDPDPDDDGISRRDLSPDLRLRLGIFSPNYHHRHPAYDYAASTQSQSKRVKRPQLRSTLGNSRPPAASLFVKVYMEGLPIGRKLDLLAIDDYSGLVSALENMFGTTINSCPAADLIRCEKQHYDHVLTYQDKEGDWMMVGDVPWQMFLCTVKRLKIRRRWERY